MNRRDFVRMLAAASGTLTRPFSLAEPSSAAASAPVAQPRETSVHDSPGFPEGDYTPYGYLDNPWHTWDLRPSGVLRSLPGIGFGLYYPAGPGGYFDFHRNGVYVAELTLGFRIADKIFISSEDFAANHLSASHHTKNILAFTFEASGLRITSSFFQVNEDALAARIEIRETAGRPQSIQLLAAHTYTLGGSQWWGGDGLAGGFDEHADTLWIRSFAAGAVFALRADRPNTGHYFSGNQADHRSWLGADPKRSEPITYSTQPLHGGLLYKIDVAAHGRAELTVLLARGANLPFAFKNTRVSLAAAQASLSGKHAEDAAFWSSAPILSGDWPAHWQRGWVYDFETLRTMVRRPIGVYRHPWDAMQIQAPRSVLAESSIDMWALSYASPALAKGVFVGQFLDAVSDNVPCMREDGVMNMVASDGSECGTSISWCFPFFCAASIYNRTRDREWLRQLYPRLAALLRWTLANRVDSSGFVVGKCSWETGMDTSKRFQIEQPTGGEVVEFLRLVELQAAASHAAEILALFASVVGDNSHLAEWKNIRQTYAEKTQQLWRDDWFHDYDARANRLVVVADRDPSQAAPAFCGIASDDQNRRILPTLHKMFDSMQQQVSDPHSSASNPLNWSSFMLPYLESAWSAGDRELAAKTVETVSDRVYRSIDRRSVEVAADGAHPRLGWPGTSCEIWGAHGAFGGEVYGWGAVMPAHIIRNLMGFRETRDADRIVLSPGLGPLLASPGKHYAIERLAYGAGALTLRLTMLDSGRVRVHIEPSPGISVFSVSDSQGRVLELRRIDSAWQFETANFEPCTVKLAMA